MKNLYISYNSIYFFVVKFMVEQCFSEVRVGFVVNANELIESNFYVDKGESPFNEL